MYSCAGKFWSGFYIAGKRAFAVVAPNQIKNTFIASYVAGESEAHSGRY